MKYEHRIVVLNSQTIIADREKIDAEGEQGFRLAGIVQAYADAEGYTHHPQVIMERAVASPESP